ncbi:hypothetical protein dqs_0265 [Azoarcus olearius]|uniref:GTPase/DUF3482 domain-containing protein n=1 Tax=Azoarcus sp. (strain BH72) TaxID=418699 RepID=UPI0008061883|nr:GTPase/DUF3482 domain-containing protein [Azoarcus olearius]ANQ83342.1 hypothetical protein dqs_0265 [Azoarcus olearius]
MSLLRIAVVGHTNTGKTSLLRTLARDAGFGEVSDRAGSTRHVEGLRLFADGEAVIELFDTPGMEDAIALLEHLEGLAGPGERIDGPERVARFLAGAEAAGRYEQEAKVLRQLLASDAGLYVVDARDPVLPKHRDELAILAGCARPLLPVLNFVRAADARPQAWREALARLGLHAVVSFDTVAPARDGERLLFEALATLLHGGRAPLARLLAARAREALARQHAARRLGAALLVQLAALRVTVAADPTAIAAATETLQAAVRAREQACVEALLALYRFRSDDLSAPALPLVAGRWASDLFNPESLRQFGVRVGGGAAAGAAAGVGVDLLAGGLTLGAAAALGALAGSVLQVAGGYRERLLARVRGQRELTVDDAVLRLLALRLHALVEALEGRGHAALDPIRLADPGARRWREAALPAELRRARSHPEWARGEGPGYEAAVQALADAEAAPG